jgi:DNA-directed RNA polymerase subunit RPC12/RpoP
MTLRLEGQTVWSSFRRMVAFVPASAHIETKIGLEGTALGYCLECRKKVEIQNPKRITLKNNRLAIKDVCPRCGTKIFLIGET